MIDAEPPVIFTEIGCLHNISISVIDAEKLPTIGWALRLRPFQSIYNLGGGYGFVG